MSDSANREPCFANAIANARPIPEAAPVITTRRWSKDTLVPRRRPRRVDPSCARWVRELTLSGATVYPPIRVQDTGLGQRLYPSACSRINWSPKTGVLLCDVGDSQTWLYAYRSTALLATQVNGNPVYKTCEASVITVRVGAIFALSIESSAIHSVGPMRLVLMLLTVVIDLRVPSGSTQGLRP